MIQAFTTSGWAFVLPLVVIQLGRVAWTLVKSRDAGFREHRFRVLIWFIPSTPLWIVGAAVNPEARLLWWALATVIDQTGRLLEYPLPGKRFRSSVMHIAIGERVEGDSTDWMEHVSDEQYLGE